MANGIRERRQAGWKQDSGSLDALERLLGIGEGIAGRVQENRNSRSEAYKIRMAGLLDSGPNKAPLHMRTFDNDVIDGLKKTL